VVFRLEEGGGRERRRAGATGDGVACQRWGCQHAAGWRRARVGGYGAAGMPLEVGGSGTGTGRLGRARGGWGAAGDGAPIWWAAGLGSEQAEEEDKKNGE
jgi:hypothetical protein